MKKITLILMALLITNSVTAKTESGIFVSLLNSQKFIGFSDTGYGTVSGENKFSDFMLKFVNISRNKFEINLVFNKSRGENVNGEFYLFNYDMTGYGVELGKVISVWLFDIGEINIECEFTAGLFGMLYMKREIEKLEEYENVDSNELVNSSAILKQRFGFYTTIRTLINLRSINLYLGLQSQLPLIDNTFSGSNSRQLFKSYLFAGISF
ncbi:MAG: hypothetical protein ABFR75_05400 [Acidobacteriota bacterium]